MHNLRSTAEQRLETGTAPPTRGWTSGAQALTLLHSLASAPETASDALKLLHELQVYQVELDLQQEQADHNRRQLTEELQRHVDLFELAPFAYLRLDPQGIVLEANRIACAWLRCSHDDWVGQRIEDFLAPDNRTAVHVALADLRKGSSRASFAAQSRADGSPHQATATSAPDRRSVLMAFTPIGATAFEP